MDSHNYSLTLIMHAVDSDASAQWFTMAERLSHIHPLSMWLLWQPRVLCL